VRILNRGRTLLDMVTEAAKVRGVEVDALVVELAVTVDLARLIIVPAAATTTANSSRGTTYLQSTRRRNAARPVELVQLRGCECADCRLQLSSLRSRMLEPDGLEPLFAMCGLLPGRYLAPTSP
jgi:hypothetical protein